MSGKKRASGRKSEILIENGGVKAGSLKALFEYLLEFPKQDLYSSVTSFVAALPIVANPKDLFRILKSTLESSDESSQSTILLFLWAWVDRYLDRDFSGKNSGSMSTKRLIEFIETKCNIDYPANRDAVNMIKLAIIRQKLSKSETFPMQSPKTSGSKKGKIVDGQFDFKDLDPVSVADQLTVMEWSLFKRMEDKELFHLAWKSPNGKEIAPNVYLLTERSNMVSYWVATEIVMSGELKERIGVLRKFILVAQRCYEIGNFNTLMEIIGGIGLSSVQRLKNTWANMSKEDMKTLKELQTCMDPIKNFINYREEISRRDRENRPALPYLGMYLRDLTFAEEGGNEDFKGELINFEKLQIVGKVFSELHKFRAKGYEFPHDDVHGRFFQKLLVLPEEVLYKHSLMCEPSDKPLE